MFRKVFRESYRFTTSWGDANTIEPMLKTSGHLGTLQYFWNFAHFKLIYNPISKHVYIVLNLKVQDFVMKHSILKFRILVWNTQF